MKLFKKSRISAALGVALTLSAATVFADHTTLTNSAGWEYRFDPSESELSDIENPGAGLTDIISSAFRLYVDGVVFNGPDSSTVLDGEGLLTGSQTLSGLEITRETYVPTNSNFVRQISTLTNSTGSAIVVTVAMNNNNLSATGAAVTVPSSSSGDAAAGTDDVWLVVNGDVGDAVMAHVFGSTGASEVIDAMTTVTGNNTFGYEWQSVSVPAGGTVKFVTFTAGEADDTAAAATAASLSSLADFTVQMKGIASADYSKIVNLSVADSDGDGMVDAYETANGLNPAVDDSAGDLDGDGLTNIAEHNASTNPNNTDTDGDGLSDGDEVNTHSTDPLDSDSDGDGLSDGAEITAGSNPNDGRDGSYLEISSSNDVHSPVVAVDSLGRMHVVWMEEVGTPDPMTPTTIYTDFNVMYKLLGQDANILIDTTQLSDSFADGNRNQGHPGITVDTNNHAYVSWFGSGGNGSVVGVDPSLAALDGSASTLATIQKFAPVAIADCKRSDLAVDSNGNIHMACADANNNVINMAVIAADGTVVTAPYAVTDADSNGDYGVSRVSLALDSMNRGVIAYYDYTSSGTGGEMAYSMVDGVAGTTLTASTHLSSNGTSDNLRHPSISLTAAGVAYMTWGDDTNGVQLAKFTPSLDDMSGDAAATATIGYSQTSISGTDPGAWYMSSALGSDGELVLTYNADGGGSKNGNGIAPRYFVKLDSANNVTTAETGIDPDIDSDVGNYSTYANYMGIAKQNANLVAYITDASQSIVKLTRLDGSAFFVTTDPNAPEPEPEKKKKKSSGFLSLWLLLGISSLVGLRRLGRRKQ